MAKRISKRLKNAYRNYVKRYRRKEKTLSKHGFDMYKPMMNSKEYRAFRQAYIDQGVKTNVNQTIVSEQAYEYSQKTARQFKEVAERFSLEWKGNTVMELRKGIDVDVSAINNMLKELHEDWTGYDRANYISHEVFGSK